MDESAPHFLIIAIYLNLLPIYDMAISVLLVPSVMFTIGWA